MNTGGSLILLTVIVKFWLTDSPDKSVAVIIISWFPTSELSGVPDNTPVDVFKDNHVGSCVLDNVIASPISISLVVIV